MVIFHRYVSLPKGMAAPISSLLRRHLKEVARQRSKSESERTRCDPWDFSVKKGGNTWDFYGIYLLKVVIYPTKIMISWDFMEHMVNNGYLTNEKTLGRIGI